MPKIAKRSSRIGYYRRRKPKDILLQNYIGVDHALLAVEKRIIAMKNPSKRKIVDLIEMYRARIAEYAEAISPGSSRALWRVESKATNLP
jgi:hypothetical protein